MPPSPAAGLTACPPLARTGGATGERRPCRAGAIGLEPVSVDIRTRHPFARLRSVICRSLTTGSVARLRPVSVGSRTCLCKRSVSRRERVWRGQRPDRDFLATTALSGHRDWDSRLCTRQSRGKLKTFPPARGNRLCARLRGGGCSPARTRLTGKFPS